LYIFHILLFVRKHLETFEVNKNSSCYRLRPSSLMLHYPIHNTAAYERSTFYMGLRLYNKLPTFIKNETCFKKYRQNLFSFLIGYCFYSVNEFLALPIQLN